MKKPIAFCLLATLLLVLMFEGAFGRVSKVPSEYKSIQKAIDAAAVGDTVLVGPGTYKENLVLAKSVSLISTKGPAKTVIDAGRRGVALMCRWVDSTATIRGFTFKNGVGLHGGGVFLSSSFVSVTGNVFTGDSAKYGGALCALWSNSVIKNNRFSGNKAAYGGGIYTMLLAVQIDSNIVEDNTAQIAGGVYIARSSEARVRGNVIRGNQAERGGGVFVNTAAPVLEANLFRENRADEGGAVSSFRSGGAIRENIMWENEASKGAAIALTDTIAPDVRRNTIVLNSAPDSLSAGIYCSSIYADVINNVFAYNSPGYAVYCTEGATPVLSCNIFWNNETGDYYRVLSETADIYEDPLFCAPKKGDFSVREDSPALGGPCGTIGALGQGCKGPKTSR